MVHLVLGLEQKNSRSKPPGFRLIEANAHSAASLPGNRARPAPSRHFRSCALGPWRTAQLEDMATSRLPPATLTLKQFLRRQQVLQLYRRILQAIRQVPNDSDRRYLKDWAREEFKRNKSVTEEDAIRMMITQGNMQLKELEKTLALARS
ncbi:LYR motif-containing protein 2 [Camelus dromedarius]|uniref:LYR motif-containing protein 2 n=3 Tax=Camelus TaxID=9836 RepID=A0A5N4DVW5_CAMDR|nr:LYR motif-containing protein 2 [Camelus dromedarius]